MVFSSPRANAAAVPTVQVERQNFGQVPSRRLQQDSHPGGIAPPESPPRTAGANALACFTSRLDPQFGQTGDFGLLTRISRSCPQSSHIKRNNGISHHLVRNRSNLSAYKATERGIREPVA